MNSGTYLLGAPFNSRSIRPSKTSTNKNAKKPFTGETTLKPLNSFSRNDVLFVR